jgi:exopolyphosphatase/guanosine-5'-triphosphate,3'-diphosphate pyrophosphatase
MEAVRRAVIDVGTNSIKLLVAEVSGHEVRPVWEGSRQTRLGQGFYETHQLQPEPIARTAQAVTEFVQKARAQQAVSIRVIATSAAREAVNGPELTSAIEQSCGLPVEIISGEQEADLAFKGVTTDPALAREPLLLLDVGGGSTEFILGQGERTHFRQSFPLGTVRLMEKLPHSDPPKPGELAGCRQWLKGYLQEEVRPKLGPALSREGGAGVNFVGTGGTASILARMEAGLQDYERERMEATRLSGERLHWHLEHLWSLPLAKRKKVVGLPPNRADVILTGLAIYAGIMDEFGFSELRISTRGLRFAAVMEA